MRHGWKPENTTSMCELCTDTPAMKPTLTLTLLQQEAKIFAERESQHLEPALQGINDGKTIGTYLEHKFQEHLLETYTFGAGNSALGIDFPSLEVDIKVTSIKQPQSSSPFRSARQKIFGLGYHLIVFVYEKIDTRMVIHHVIFIEKERAADYTTTKGICDILDSGGNDEDLIAFMMDRNLPLDDITASLIAEELITRRPTIGCLTMSNALQWRLQYARAITVAGTPDWDGVVRI